MIRYLKFNKYENLIKEYNNINFEYKGLKLNKNKVIKNLSPLLRNIYYNSNYSKEFKELTYNIFNSFLNTDNKMYLSYYLNLLLEHILNE